MTDSPKRLKIDFEELQLAFQGSFYGDIENYLDTETGEVIPLHDEFEDADEIRARIDEGLGERYRYIEPMEAHESFRIMEDFAASLPESAAKTRLIDALSRNKPFGRFKNIVHSDFALRGQWFIFRDDAFARYASDWLEAVGIQADLQRRKQ